MWNRCEFSSDRQSVQFSTINTLRIRAILPGLSLNSHAEEFVWCRTLLFGSSDAGRGWGSQVKYSRAVLFDAALLVSTYIFLSGGVVVVLSVYHGSLGGGAIPTLPLWHFSRHSALSPSVFCHCQDSSCTLSCNPPPLALQYDQIND